MLLSMGKGMVWRVLTVGAVLGVVLTPAASAHPQTTAPNIFVNVHVTLTDTKIIISPKSAPRGSDARFIVVNKGTKAHSFTLGSTRLGSSAQTGFTRVVKPKQQQILLIYLNARGALPYYGGATPSKSLSAMKGSFIVGAQCALCVPDD